MQTFIASLGARAFRTASRQPYRLLLLAALGLLPMGCGPALPGAAPPPTAPNRAPFMAVLDDAGRRVVLQSAPRRIVSLSPSATETLYALGLDDRIVAVDSYSDYPPAAKHKPQIGGFAAPDIEQIISATPDLVVAAGIHALSLAPALQAHGIPVLIIDPRSLDQVLQRITLLGRMTGRETQAAVLVRDMQRKMDGITARVSGAPRPRVFYELSPDLFTAGPGSFMNDLIARAGGQNIGADADRPWPQLSQETVILRDPDVILLGKAGDPETPATVRSRPGWQKISAVRTGRIVVIDPDTAERTGPRIMAGLEDVARMLHPDRFPREPRR